MSKFEVNATLEGFQRIDFDRKPIKKTMRQIGQKVQTDARRLVARRAISGGGDYPGRDAGALYKATKYRVSRSGFLVSIQPRATEGTIKNGEFYPGILYYGVRRGAVRRQDRKKQTGSGPWKIEPRGNWTVDAAESRREWAQQTIAEALRASLLVK